jgi:hypothetical protein
VEERIMLASGAVAMETSPAVGATATQLLDELLQ